MSSSEEPANRRQHPAWTREIGVIRSGDRTLRLNDDLIWWSDSPDDIEIITQLNSPDRSPEFSSQPAGFLLLRVADSLGWEWELSRPVSEEIDDHCTKEAYAEFIQNLIALEYAEGKQIERLKHLHPERWFAQRLYPLLYFPKIVVWSHIVELIDCREPAVRFLLTPASLEIYFPAIDWDGAHRPLGPTLRFWKRVRLDRFSGKQLDRVVRKAYQHRRRGFGYCSVCGGEITPGYNFPQEDNLPRCSDCAGVVF